MHGHVHGVGGQTAQPQTMVQMQKAAALREAAQVRQSLLRAAAKEFAGAGDGDSVQLSNAWSAAGAGYGSNGGNGGSGGASSVGGGATAFKAVTTSEPMSQGEAANGSSTGISYWV